MFTTTVTVFNFFRNEETDTSGWYPKVLRDVELQVNSGVVSKTKGKETVDQATLYIPFCKDMKIQGHPYRKPLEWKREEEKDTCLTLSEDDFFAEGEFDTVYVDEDEYPQGFYEYMKSTYDDVYAVTSVSRYETIPHFEVGGA